MKDLRICFVGDSFTNGTLDPSALGWAGRVCVQAVAAGHLLTYYNLGVRRETSSEIMTRWLAEVRPRLPPGDDGRLVFSFGANDTTIEDGRSRVPVEQSLTNAHAMLSEAAQRWPVL